MKKNLLKSMFAMLILSAGMNVSAQSVNTTGAAQNYADTEWEHYAAENYAGGTGSKEDPYLIATPQQFLKLAVEVENIAADDNNWGGDYSEGKYWKQTADLVFNENVLRNIIWENGDAVKVTSSNFKTYKGIGYNASEADFQYFAGEYDGNGHSISGIYVFRDKNKSTGIFNYAVGATIKNMIIKDSYYTANANVGLIGGSLTNTVVLNCQTSGVIYCGGSHHAGIAGSITDNSKVLNCCSDAWTWAKNNVGGLVGKMGYSSYMNNSFCNGWIGAVFTNLSGMKYWGILCPYIGGNTKEKAETLTVGEDGLTYTCENPSKIENSYWGDTCSVRHKNVAATAFSGTDFCMFAVLNNCKAVAANEITATVEALNAEAAKIEGACGWKVGTNGMPALDFSTITTGINYNTISENGLTDVYSVQGVLLRRNVDRQEATQGLPAGIYIVDKTKVIVK